MEKINGSVIKTTGAVGKEAKEGRPVAVDWALSKDKWEETQKGKEGDAKDIKPDIKSEDGSDDSGSDSDSDSDSDEKDEDEEDKPDIEMEEEEPVKPKLPTVDVGSTLFIRNLPFETTEQELGELFRTFGPLRYARITIDKFTGRSRGSGFVCFWNVEHADRAIEEAEKVASETGANAMPVCPTWTHL
jgi:nucleolar protein 4